MAKKKIAEEKTVEHSPKFDLIKSWYDSGRWSLTAVRNAVIKGWIAAAEFEEITGEVYE